MRVLRISPKNCYRSPHVVTDPKLDKLWRARIASEWDGHSKKIGIVWAGDPKHGNDRARSIPIDKFMEIVRANLARAQFFSFQAVPGLKQLFGLSQLDQSFVVDLGSDFRNFDDTASALRQMDLLISCDTSVPHLAGCMGIPTWIMIPNPPEWRWLTHGKTTSWYESVRLFRQSAPLDWNPVISAVASELRDFARK
jgi:ADP-heptose:LPS heptosyltransferase